MSKTKIYLTILLLLFPAILKSQIVDYYPKADSLCIEGHCMHPEIILSTINGTMQDTLVIKCWSTVWWPEGIKDFDYLKGDNIFYVINDPDDHNRYEVWIEAEDSLNLIKMLVPFDRHFSFFFKYFKLKVCVLSNNSLTDSLVQYFKSFMQVGINESLNQLESGDAPVIKNYPNPFNSQTTILYRLRQDSEVSLKIYNSIGQEIVKLISVYQSAGEYAIRWNTTNLSSNTYYIKLQTGTAAFIKKCMLIK